QARSLRRGRACSFFERQLPAPALAHNVVLEFHKHVSAGHVLVAAGEDQEDVAVTFLGLLVAVFPKLMPRLDLLLARRLTQRREHPRLAGLAGFDRVERGFGDVVSFAFDFRASADQTAVDSERPKCNKSAAKPFPNGN